VIPATGTRPPARIGAGSGPHAAIREADMDEGTEIRRLNTRDIRDGDLVVVIVEEPGHPGAYRVVGYTDGAAVPLSVAEARRGPRRLKAPCVCGSTSLTYVGFSHEMPDVHPWPTLIYRCGSCQRTLSLLRLTAEDARRAIDEGLGTLEPDDD
jgi:hypothetical protein